MPKDSLDYDDKEHNKIKHFLKTDPAKDKQTSLIYFEEVYKSLLEQHQLGNESSANKNEDPLSPNSSDVIQQAEDNTNQAKTFLDVRNDDDGSDDNLEFEEHHPHEQMENQVEFIKIEIVEDEVALSNSEGISYKNSLENSSQLVDGDVAPKEKKTKPLTKRRVKGKLKRTKVILPNRSSKVKQKIVPLPKRKQKVEPKTPAPMELSYSVTPLLSFNDLSAMELNFNLDFNCNDTTDDERIISLTGITSEILDICETCMENALYSENISDAKNIRLKIILVLIKLKTNLSCKILATMLGLTEHVCSMIFYSTLDVFFASMKPAIFWVSGKELKDGRAKHFKGDPFGVRVILHKLDFKVMECQESECNFDLCEEYNKHKSVTVIIGLSMKKHLFSYVSNTYNTNMSIDAMLKKEKMFSHLCYRGDIVVVTNDAKTQSMYRDCRKLGIELKVLPVMRQYVQDYVYNILYDLEQFEIIRSREIHSHMVPFIGKAVSAICGALNLRFEAENIEIRLR